MELHDIWIEYEPAQKQTRSCAASVSYPHTRPLSRRSVLQSLSGRYARDIRKLDGELIRLKQPRMRVQQGSEDEALR